MQKVVAYFKESKHELLNKVSWPTLEELQSSVVIVLIASSIFAIVIYTMDLVFSKGLSFFYQLF